MSYALDDAIASAMLDYDYGIVNRYPLDDDQRDNMLELADYLEKNVTQPQFNMRSFFYDEAMGSLAKAPFPWLRDSLAKHACGTSACVLGWACVVFAKEADKILPGYYSTTLAFINPDGIGEKYLGVSRTRQPDAWWFLFGSDWPDCVHEAARRMRFYCNMKEGERYNFAVNFKRNPIQ